MLSYVPRRTPTFAVSMLLKQIHADAFYANTYFSISHLYAVTKGIVMQLSARIERLFFKSPSKINSSLTHNTLQIKHIQVNGPLSLFVIKPACLVELGLGPIHISITSRPQNIVNGCLGFQPMIPNGSIVCFIL